MKTRQETLEDIDELREVLNKYADVFPQSAANILTTNMEKVIAYADENDKWNEPCWGTDESVTYMTLYVLMDCMFVDISFSEILDDAEKFYNFVGTWFKEHVDHYRKMAELGNIKEYGIGKAMSLDCAVAVVDVIKNGEDE